MCFRGGFLYSWDLGSPLVQLLEHAPLPVVDVDDGWIGVVRSFAVDAVGDVFNLGVELCEAEEMDRVGEGG